MVSNWVDVTAEKSAGHLVYCLAACLGERMDERWVDQKAAWLVSS